MPDLITDEHTRALFTRLRAEELSRVAAPGTAQAHRTVRRRKTTTTVVAAGVAAVALAGGTLGYAQLTTSPAATSASTTQEDLSQLADQARRAVASGGDRAIGAAPGGFASGSGPLSGVVQNVDEGEDGRGVADGRRTLSYACRGAGKATLIWSVGDQSRTVVMACEQPGPMTVFKIDGTIAVEGSGIMKVRVEPDAEAVDRAAYAYSITQP